MNHYCIIQLNRISNIDDEQSYGFYMDHDSVLEMVCLWKWQQKFIQNYNLIALLETSEGRLKISVITLDVPFGCLIKSVVLVQF